MFFDPLTPKISPVILLTVCQTIIVIGEFGTGVPADLDPPPRIWTPQQN